jgi:allophanate hydrolase
MNPTPALSTLNITELRTLYTKGSLSPTDVVRHVYEKISSYHDKAVWIHLIPEHEALIRAEALATTYQQGKQTLPPLFGIPFSVKDSIDIEGLPTTLACPEFAYVATSTAPVIERILLAGGILIGKTNLDQFATGLAGVRSPYGIPRCVFDADYVSGGSSSGSAVSVAASLVSFTICTDTGGSTRVPAALNGLVGLKPTLGTISAEGVFPACKNIDCVCLMARTMDEAEQVWEVMRWFDERDVFARRDLPTWEPWQKSVRFGIPPRDLLRDLSSSYTELFEKVVTTLRSHSELYTECTDFDYEPFSMANQALYDSSIVTQRLVAFDSFISSYGLGSLHPAIKSTFQAAMEKDFSAVRAYEDIFSLALYKRQAEIQFRENIDILIVPSTVEHFTLAELEEEPLVRNKLMGKFANFVNLLDLAAVAVPVGLWKGKNGKNLPFSVTLVGQAGKDRELMALGKRLINSFQSNL